MSDETALVDPAHALGGYDGGCHPRVSELGAAGVGDSDVVATADAPAPVPVDIVVASTPACGKVQDFAEAKEGLAGPQMQSLKQRTRLGGSRAIWPRLLPLKKRSRSCPKRLLLPRPRPTGLLLQVCRRPQAQF